MVRGQVAIGLDLGQAVDYTAVSIVQRIDPPEGEPRYEVRRVERLALGTPYPAVGQYIQDLLKRRELQEASLVVDAMGVGMPVVDMLNEKGLRPIAVKVHGGSAETRDERGAWHIPKRNLVSTLQVLLQNRQMVIAPFPQLDKLLWEIQNFKVTISPTGHDSYEAWRESDHDDMVFALGLACWWLRHPGGRAGIFKW